MASISNTMTSPAAPFHRSDVFPSYAMASFPPPPARRGQHDELSRDPLPPPLPPPSATAPPRPVNLPPLSSIDPRHQQPAHSPTPAEAATPTPPPQPALTERPPQYGTLLPSMSQYYGSQLNASGQYVGGPSAPLAVAATASRFAIAPPSHPHSMIAGSRHKKEVKKRTKTGCMTCRKRRIKCDEGHPACRNCLKSKRECLGYDPVFKSQSPSSIQPAPHLRSPASPNAPGLLRPLAYPSIAPLSKPDCSTTENSPASLDHPDFPPRSHDRPLGQSTSGTASTNTMTDSDRRHESREHSRPEDQTIRRATQTNIDDLCWIDDQAGTPVSTASLHESPNGDALRTVYHTSFAPGLDRFLETRWFSADGYMSLAADRSLLTQFENYVAAIATTSGAVNQEARLVWSLLSMCRRRPLPGFAGEFINDKDDTLGGDEVAEKRLDVVEALLTGRQLASNPLADGAAAPPPLSPPTLPQQLKIREQSFWRHVGEFVCAADGDAVERVLRKSRKLLDNLENRDVIYSVMLMRHIGNKWHDKLIAEAEDERDSKDWLAAKDFLEREAAGQAMNIATKRVCSMALRAWPT